MTSPSVLAIDIGGTKIAAAACGPDGTLEHTHRFPTPVSDGPQAILQAAIAAGHAVIDAATRHGTPIAAVGVGSAGHIDHTCGVVTYAADTLPGWAGIELKHAFNTAWGLPVVVDNDVNAMALGEMRFGAGRSFQHALMLTVGTGVGGAIVHGGELWRGVTWSAGEIGHLLVDWDGTRRCSCGRVGHLEAYAAGPAMALRYRQRSADDADVDLRTVAARAATNDLVASEVIAEGARILGLAIGGLLSVLDMEVVVIGGGVAEIGDSWWQPLEQTIRNSAMPGPARVHLRPAELGTSAVLVGAGWLAHQLSPGVGDADRSDPAR